ncbi:MAG: von Willebrand factor type [Conexibacter sp.]|nr:von Willebrand factor type [Solirubrobacterales bacterium]MCW3005063.1 von Willebrand factor type [Conexibacter sp.]
MTFGTPLALLALAVVPVLAYAYLARQRRQARIQAAFAAPLLAASHTPLRAGVRRHVPFAIYGLALVALLVAAARPQHSVAVPVERASIMLVTDVSGSMLATDVAPNRLAAARRAGQQFVDTIPSRVNIGVMAFNHQASVLQSPTQDRQAVRAAIDRLQAAGGTATGTAVATATRILRPGGTNTDSRPPAAIVLLSDGASTKGVDPVRAAAAAKREGIRVYTVALGTAGGTIDVPRKNGTTQTKPVPPDPLTLRRMADAGGGAFFETGNADRLAQVYERLGSELGTRMKDREITPAFAAGAALLLLSGAGLSLRWFGRLI